MREQFMRAQVHVRASRYKKALNAFKRALAKADNNDEIIECHMAMADTGRMTGDFEDALIHYEAAIKLMKNNDPKRMDAKVGLALAQRALGYHKKALKGLQSAMDSYDKKGDKEGVAFTTWAHAGALRIKGDIPSAIKEFATAKKLFKSLKDEHGYGYCLCGLGGNTRVRGEFDKSLAYYTEANELFIKLKDAFGSAYTHCGIGNALRMKEEYDKAREHFVRASTLYRRIGDIVSFSYTLWSLGKTHLMTGNMSLAEKYFKDAQKNFRATKDPRGLIYCKLGLGEIKLMQGLSPRRKNESKRYFKDAIKMATDWEFGVELAHGKALLSLANDGKTDNSYYKSIGLKLKFETVPFNIP